MESVDPGWTLPLGRPTLLILKLGALQREKASKIPTLDTSAYATNDTLFGGWRFHDTALTTAEVFLRLYRTIRETAGETLIVGCNTFGHLCAGNAHLQRIGDDTSGREWARTRKMGVNALAFRAHQHEAFFSADADCVGITDAIPWAFNRQWLELLAASGTPLFVSAQAGTLSRRHRDALREAYARASNPQPLAQPLDWMLTSCPTRWNCGGKILEWDWFHCSPEI